MPDTAAARPRLSSTAVSWARSAPSSAIASATLPWTPVRSSTAQECVSELALSRVASGHAASTWSIAGASAHVRGSRSRTSYSMPIV